MMMTNSKFLFVSIFLFFVIILSISVIGNIVTAAASSDASEQQQQQKHPMPNYANLDQQEFSGLPDPDNDDDNLEMSCSACQLSVRLMTQQLDKLKLEFERQPEKLRSYHGLAQIDKLCEKNFRNVGLLSKGQEQATAKFVTEKEAKNFGGDSVLKGGWITNFFNRHCNDMLTIAEDEMESILFQQKEKKPIHLCPLCGKYEKKKKKIEKRRAAKRAKKAKKAKQQQEQQDKKNSDL